MSNDSDSDVTGLADFAEGALGRHKFYGKFRGTVINNITTSIRCRLDASR